MDDTDAKAPPEDEAPDKTEPTPDETPHTPPNISEPVITNGIKRADLPWQVVQLSESLPEDVVLVGYFLIGADHVLMTDKGFYGLHEGSLTDLKPYVIVDN